MILWDILSKYYTVITYSYFCHVVFFSLFVCCAHHYSISIRLWALPQLLLIDLIVWTYYPYLKTCLLFFCWSIDSICHVKISFLCHWDPNWHHFSWECVANPIIVTVGELRKVGHTGDWFCWRPLRTQTGSMWTQCCWAYMIDEMLLQDVGEPGRMGVFGIMWTHCCWAYIDWTKLSNHQSVDCCYYGSQTLPWTELLSHWLLLPFDIIFWAHFVFISSHCIIQGGLLEYWGYEKFCEIYYLSTIQSLLIVTFLT
jgi:hypothetical protein